MIPDDPDMQALLWAVGAPEREAKRRAARPVPPAERAYVDVLAARFALVAAQRDEAVGAARMERELLAALAAGKVKGRSLGGTVLEPGERVGVDALVKCTEADSWFLEWCAAKMDDWQPTVETREECGSTARLNVPTAETAGLTGVDEPRIRAIIEVAQQLGLNPLKIPRGSKTKLLESCLRQHAKLFGVGDSGFNRAWKKATPSRLCIADRERYVKKK